MVLESINVLWLERRPLLAFFIGMLYTVLGFLVARFFFPSSVSVPMLFLTTLLIIPSVIKLLSVEERRERKEGLHHFFQNHRDVFEICIFLFLGVFVAYLLLGQFTQSSTVQSIFSYQSSFLERQEGLSKDLIANFFQRQPQPDKGEFIALFTIDLKVTLIFFVLSFFYGAGAIFLLILNASILASFVNFLINQLSHKAVHVILILSIFSIHVLPEVGGFLLAAIAGGVVSKALIQERFMGVKFKNVMRDAGVLLFAACILILLAAYLETYATTILFYSAFR